VTNKSSSLFFALAMLTGSAGSAAGADDPFKDTDCTKATVQIELDYCANRDFEAADKRLNVLYRTLFDRSDPKRRERLKAAERKWIVYRDRDCTEETAGSTGGSIAPMEYSVCLTEKTKARIRELERQRK